MRILITGATGLVGSATARSFLAKGHTIVALHRANSDRSLVNDLENQIHWVEGDILDVLSLEKAMDQVDCVVHAAAIVSFVPRDEADMYKVNVEGTANVVNVCLKKGIRKLCHVSSVAALGRPDPRLIEDQSRIVIDETQRWTDSPNNSAYAKSKYLAELEVWRGIAEGLPAVIVNPSLILGEGDWHKSSTQLFKYVYDGKPFYTVGTVNFVDVRDIAEAVVKLTMSDIENERYVLSAGTTTYQQLFSVIASALGRKPPHIKVGPGLAAIIWRVEAMRSWLTGSRPLITKDTARSAAHHFEYDSAKIKRDLSFDFQPLDKTVKRVSESFLTAK
ncbi:SDR family NAD(P)-dependent oxidoreductase [Persicitalea jodogahamensis]|uniref:NAD-dependent epimerase n=1 Tax=Persicitalea jodogahamensis TaxID=402147 RepID=A0A8J3DA16_9BACT|nr:SDR family NAD(P)-dependent oxidoreductase [Persicitalea jodogahamensis]GHB80912.1 NAD-dependent epimerase [Persicitalea jodogahamensis]